MHPDREKNIAGRSLGTHYEKEYLETIFEENRKAFETLHQKEQEQNQQTVNSSYDYHEHEMHTFDPNYDYSVKPFTVLFIRSELQLVVNLQECMKAQQNKYYAQKVKVSNLQQYAKAIVYAEAHGYDSHVKLQQANELIQAQLSEANVALRSAKEDLKNMNLQIKYLGRYHTNKKIYQTMLHSPNIKQFRQQHKKEIDNYIEARSFLQNSFGESTFPDINDLKTKKTSYTSMIEELKLQMQQLHEQANEHQIVCSNINALLNDSPSQKRNQSKEPSL